MPLRLRTTRTRRSTRTSYTTTDALKSFFDLSKIAIKSAADIARIPLQTKPDPRVLLLADHITTVVRRGLLEATQVAADAANVVDKDPADVDQNDRNELVKSAVKIARIGMLRSAEIAQTIAAGPGAYADPVLPSDPFHIAAVGYDRKLVVETMGRKGVPNENISKLVAFDLPNGILKAGVDSFKLVANSAGLESGVYVGEVKAYVLDTGKLDGDPVEVSFAL